MRPSSFVSWSEIISCPRKSPTLMPAPGAPSSVSSTWVEIVGPALSEAGAHEPHPFGAVLRALMDNRGLSAEDLARRTYRAVSTIYAVHVGGRNPHPVLVREIAHALDIPEADLVAIAGVAGDMSAAPST
jgi:hypothetical protein